MTAVIKNWSHLNWTVTENTAACLAGNLHIHKQYMHALHALTKKVKASRICYRTVYNQKTKTYLFMDVSTYDLSSLLGLTSGI